MASWNEISDQIRQARDGHEQVRHEYLKEFHEERKGRNVISYYSGFLHNGKHRGSVGIEDRDKIAFMSLSIGKRKAEHSPTGKPRPGVEHKKGLDLILHTGGGNPNAAESIMDFLLELYQGDVEVFVPQMAMSAGTIMACGAKAIYMGTYSSLGPIDPHLDGIPVWAILQDFKEAKKDIALRDTNCRAWMPILSKYPVGIISACNVLNDLSTSIVTKWLKRENGMFSSLTTNERDRKAEEIVKALTNYDKLKSHERHISMSECRNEIGFGDKIIDLAGDPSYDKMKGALLSYHHTCEHTLRDKTAVSKIIENHLGHVIYMFDDPKPASIPMAEMASLENFKAFMEQETADLIETEESAT